MTTVPMEMLGESVWLTIRFFLASMSLRIFSNSSSELAFARMLGKTEFVPHFNKWKTELDIPGMGEIRYSFNPKGGLRFTKRDNPDLKYVLMIDGMAIKNRTGRNEDRRSTPYKAIGWMYGHECIQDIYLSKYNNTTWVVPYDKLKAMPN